MGDVIKANVQRQYAHFFSRAQIVGNALSI